MKLKNLMGLVVILAVLVGLILYQKSKERTIPISEQAGLVSLMPDGVASTDLKKIQLYNGGKPEAKIELAWDAGGEKWRVTNHFNAPVSKQKIDEFLAALGKLKGELRTEAASDAELEQYNLSDAKAFHVEGFKADAQEPAVRLLIGKSPSYGTVFMRAADNKRIYVESTNLRQQAGVTTDDAETVPEAATWVEKTALDLDADSIQRIELATPDKNLTFELREKKIEAPATPETPPADGEQQPEGTPPTPPAPKVEHEWALAAGGYDSAFKQTGVDALVRKLDMLTVTDIVDPATKAAWGLEPPSFKCTVGVKGQDQPVVIEGGRPDPSSDGYIRVASAKEDVVYKVNSFTFEQIFPKGGDLFTLPSLTVDSKEIDKIEITQPEGNLVLMKAGDAWTVQQPATDLPPQTSTLQTIATALSTWRPVDYADSAEGRGLDAPVRAITFTAGPAVSHTITLGADSKSFGGAYAQLDGSGKILAMSKSDITRLFVMPKDAFQRTLLDVDESALTQIDVQRATGSFTLAKQGEVWSLTADGLPAETNEEAVEAFVSSLASLQASDILFGKTELDGPADATVVVKEPEGKEYTLVFGAEADGKRQLKLSGKNELFEVESAGAQTVLPAVDTLKKTAPAQPETAAPAPATEQSAAPTPDPEVVIPAAPPEQSVIIPSAPAGPAESDPAPAEPSLSPAAPAPAAEATPSAPVPTEPAPAPVGPVPAPVEPVPAPVESLPPPAAPEAPAPQPKTQAPAAPAPHEAASPSAPEAQAPPAAQETAPAVPPVPVPEAPATTTEAAPAAPPGP